MAELPQPRIHAFDWLRGLAVLVMIQTHALVLLRPELRVAGLYTWLQRIDGLVAPAFIFSAGFSLALVQVRAGLAGRRRAQARKSLTRVLEVLGVASLINFIWFPVLRHPSFFLRLDILHCIGLSLLISLPWLGALSTRPGVLRWLMLGLALATFGLAPLAEGAQGLASLFLTNHLGYLDATTGAEFPLVPWAGYVFLGASFGATVGMMRHERQLWAWLSLLLGLGALLWWQQPALITLYPAHDFWQTNPANSAQRWVQVLALVAGLRLLEIQWPALLRSRLVQWLAAFGSASLSAYFFHEMLLYEHHLGLFTLLWRGRAGWPEYWALLGSLIAATWLCVRWWSRTEPRVRARLRLKPGSPPAKLPV